MRARLDTALDTAKDERAEATRYANSFAILRADRRPSPRAFLARHALLATSLWLLVLSAVLIPAGAAFAVAQEDQAATAAVGRPAARAPAPASRSRSRPIVVKYRTRGARRLSECAQRLSEAGEPFAAHLADGSDSLDRLHARFGLRRHQALFRDARGLDYPTGRIALEARLERARERARDRAAGRGGRAPTSRRSTTARARGARVEPLPDLAHVYRIEVPPGQSAAEVVAALGADPHVEYAQLDHAIELDQALPFDDPYLTSEGSWGQPYGDLWGLEQIRAAGAWARTLGEGSLVAVVDTGLDRFHPDIAANVWVNPGEDTNGDGLAGPEDENGIDDDGNGLIDDLTGFDFADSVDADQDGRFDGPQDVNDADPFDERGHGTHVSGTIAAVADNGLGIVGVAPGARLMALKGFPAEGSATDSVLWRAVLYAAEAGADVVNNSWSCSTPCPDNPLAREVLAIVQALGTVVVTSAGNATTDVVFNVPENSTDVLTIGALGQDERLADFSNRGWGIDLVAPGGGPHTPFTVRVARRNILSLLTSALDPELDPFSVDDDYWRLAGTSMSAPHVAGAVALLAEARPGLDPGEVRRLLRLSARDLGPPGHDPIYGAGVLDLSALLDEPLPDLDLGFDSPESGTTVSALRGFVDLRGRASGTDLDRVELAVARGRTGRVFETIATPEFTSPLARSAPGPDPGPAPVLYRWPLEDVPTGPHVLRLRGFLRDGRIVDEFLVLGVERIAPTRVSLGEFAVGGPAISGRRVVWPVAESDEAGADFDLATATLPTAGRVARAAVSTAHSAAPLAPGPMRAATEPGAGDDPGAGQRLLEREGSQTDVALDGRNLIWREWVEATTSLAWCRLAPESGDPKAQSKQSDCEARAIETGPGVFRPPYAGGGWFVWQRDEGATRHVEGCFVSPSEGECRAAPIIEADGTRWTLRSFDGRTLLLQTSGRDALCAIRKGEGPCVPVDLAVAPGTGALTEPVHDGRLIAFREVAVEVRPPAVCLPGEVLPECAPALTVLVRYRACLLDSGRVCDSIPITPFERVESFAGVAVEGRRIVWTKGTDAESPALYFCEFDAMARACPEQRVLGALAAQDAPAIAGDRLLWRDARAGQQAIWSHVLPGLSGPTETRARAGRPFSIALRATPGASQALSYSLESIEGLDPAEARARVFDRGRAGGRVELRGRLPREVTEPLSWRITATASDGLSSSWPIAIEVAPRPNVGVRKSWAQRLWPLRRDRARGPGSKPDR